MSIIKGIAILLIAVLLVLLLSNCAMPPTGSPLDYQKNAACAELVGELNGVEFAAIIEIGEMPSDGSERYAVLTFSKPKALEGVKLKREGGASVLTVDGIKLPAGLFSQFFLPVDAFSLLSDIVECKKREGKDSINYNEIILSDGSVILTDSESGYPIRITHQALNMDVIGFMPIFCESTKGKSK